MSSPLPWCDRTVCTMNTRNVGIRNGAPLGSLDEKRYGGERPESSRQRWAAVDEGRDGGYNVWIPLDSNQNTRKLVRGIIGNASFLHRGRIARAGAAGVYLW